MPNSHSGFVVTMTLLAGLMLTLLPMPDWAVWIRPAWVLLIVIYWCLYLPYRVNVGTAWVMGLMLDVLSGTLLGEHALAMTIVIYIVTRMDARMRMFPLAQQGMSVLILVLLYQAIIYCVQGFIGQLPPTWLYWAGSVSSMLLWPWVFSLLKDCHQRFKVA